METVSTSVCVAHGLLLLTQHPGGSLWAQLFSRLCQCRWEVVPAREDGPTSNTYSESGRHKIQREFQDGFIQNEFLMGASGRSVLEGRLLGGGESGESYNSQEAGDVSGD